MQSTRSVPFFNYPSLFSAEAEELTSIFAEVGRRGAFIQQRDLEDFEQNLARYVGARYVLGIANATDALHLAVRAAGIGPGDEVIFCSHTMVATAASVHFAGATPVPVECRADHLIDPAAVNAAITSRTKAILPTQLNGRTCDMDALQAIALQHGLLLLEDAAQALGSRFRNRFAGTFGLASCISFYPAKTLGCLGDGGCVITNDDEMYRKLRMLRDHGRDESGEVCMWGLNSRLDNLQAAILDYKLKTYDQAIARRRHIAAMYQERLGNLPQLKLPPGPESDSRHFDIYQNYELEAEQRDELRMHLKVRGIGTLIQWGGKPVHQFSGLGFQQKLPFTDEMFTRLLMLPLNTALSDDDVHYVCDCVQEFYNTAVVRNSRAA
jgi:dTDP-4-amino-4,6-dideoxygalactose transaminase